MDTKNAILDRLADSVMLLDLNLNYQYLNNAAAAVIGIDCQQVIGKHILHIHPYLKEYSLYQDFNKALQTQLYICNQQFYPDRQLWFEHHIHPSAEGLTVYARDITEQKNAEQKQQQQTDELKKNEKWFRTLVENANDIIFTLSQGSVLTYVSPNWTETMGYEVSEFIGKLIIEKLVHPDDIANCQAILKQTFLSGQKQTGIEFRIKHKDGTWRWHTSSLSPLFDSNGTIDSIVGIARDTTTNKLALIELKENEHFLNEFQHAANVGSFHLNFATGICKSSRLLDTIFGIGENYPPTVQGWVELIHPDFSVKMQNYLEEIVIEKKNFDKEYKIIRPVDGTERWVHGLGVISYDKNNDPISLIGIIEDITNKKLAEEAQQFNTQLLEATQIIGKLGSWEFNLLTEKLTWTNETYRIHDTTREDFDSNLGINYCLPESKKILLAAMEAAKIHGTPYDLELEKVTLKGRRITIRTTCQVTLQDGKPAKLTGIVQDITEKKATEAKLRQSQNRIRAFFEATTDAVILADKNYAIIEFNSKANQTALKFFGISIIIGQNILDFTIPANRHIFMKDFKEALKGNSIDKEFKLEIPGKESSWWNFRLIPMFDDQQQIFGVSFNSIDITDKKSAEELLSISLKETSDYKYAINESSNVTFTDKDGLITYANDNFCKISKYSREELIGQNHRIINSDFHTVAFFNVLWSTIQNGKIWKGEVKSKAKDGTFFWIEQVIVPFLDDAGVPFKFVAITKDITKRKNAEQQLKLLESVVTNTKDSIFITEAEPIDEPGPRILYVNEAFTQMTGYTAEEVIGKTPRILQGPLTDKVALKHLRESIRKWESCEITTLNYRKNGDLFWVNLSMSPVADESGDFTHWISIQRDVTQRKNYELQNELISAMSRTFNEPDNLNTTLESILKQVAAFAGFDMAEAWLVSTDYKKINLAARYLKTAALQLKYKENQHTTSFAKGVSLPGKAWQTKTIQHWNNSGDENWLLLQEATKNAGFKTAYALPLIYNNEVVGVLTMAHSKKEKPLHLFTPLFQRLSTHLGAEIRRKQLEQEFNQIFSMAPDVISILGADGYFKRVNPAGAALLKYSNEELLAHSFLEFVHPDDKLNTNEELNNLNKGQAALYFENRILTSTGKVKWFAWTFNPDMEAGMIFAMARDITESKKLKDLLDKANNLARIGNWEFDVINQYIYWSDITREIHEVNDRFIVDLTSGINFYKAGKNRDTIMLAVETALTKGTSWDLELQIITAKGNEKWIRTIGETEFASGKCTRIYGSFQDIDAGKKAELAIAEVMAEKAVILESIGDAFFAVDKNFIVTYWNKEAERSLKRTRQQMLGNNLWDIFGDAINSPSYIFYKKAIDENEIQYFEIFYETLSKWFDVSAYPSHNGLSVYFKDITDKKNSVEKLRQSNERYERVALATSDAVWDWDIETGIVIRTGDGFFKLFGYNPALTDKDVGFWVKKIHPDDLQKVEVRRSNIFNNTTDTYWEDEYRFKNALEEYVHVYDKGYIIRDENGKAIRMIGATQDISKIKEKEQELQGLNIILQKQAQDLAISNKELEYFAYVASHDLQEPLRMVSSFLSQLEKKYNDVIDERGKQYIRFAVDGANRMKQLILDLLEFSRVGKTAITTEVVDLNNLVEEILILLGKQIEEKKASISCAPLPVINTFKTPVRQVFQNLISNSLKYQQKDVVPCVTISFTETNELWQFAVADNGIGISDKYFEKIFVLFQRLHNKDEYSGTGIGLAVTKKIIENMGGEIWVNSEMGKGSTFYFTIPKNLQ